MKRDTLSFFSRKDTKLASRICRKRNTLYVKEYLAHAYKTEAHIKKKEKNASYLE